MKATELLFIMLLFIMLYKVVLTFEFLDETLKRDHSNESYGAVPSCRVLLCCKRWSGLGYNLTFFNLCPQRTSHSQTQPCGSHQMGVTLSTLIQTTLK